MPSAMDDYEDADDDDEVVEEKGVMVDVGIQRGNEIGNAQCDPESSEMIRARIKKLSEIPVQGKIKAWTKIGRSLRKGTSDKYVEQDVSGTMVLKALGTMNRVSFVGSTIVCAPPSSSTATRQGEIRHYSDVGIVLRDKTVLPQMVCDRVVIQGLDQKGIDRRVAPARKGKDTRRRMCDNYVRIGLPRYGFEYIMRWVEVQLRNFEERPSMSNDYFWHNAGTGGAGHQMGTTFVGPDGMMTESRDLAKVMSMCGYKSLLGRATVSLSLSFANKFDSSAMKNRPNERVGKLSIKVHHMLMTDYGNWAGPVQVMSITNAGTGVGAMKKMPMASHDMSEKIKDLYNDKDDSEEGEGDANDFGEDDLLRR